MSHHSQRTSKSPLASLALILIAVLLGTAATQAADRDRSFKEGDQVEVNVLGEWKVGTVTEVLPNGWLMVEVEGRFAPKLATPGNFRPVKSSKGATGSGGENPFATPDEQMPTSEMRKWTDRSGRFDVVAKLIRTDGESVVLEREDGKEITVPIARLSDADYRYVESFAGAFEEDGEFGTLEPKETNLNLARRISVEGDTPWTYTPDPAPETAKNARPVRISLGETVDFLDRPTNLFLFPEAKQVFAIFQNDFPERAGQARVYACDLAARKIDGIGAFPAGQAPVAASGDGQWVVGREASRHRVPFDHGSTFYLNERTGDQVKPKVMWQPYQHEHEAIRDVVWAELVQDEALLTIGRSGELVLWSLPDVEPVWVAKGASQAHPALSPGGRVVALPYHGGVTLIEAMTGETLGRLETDRLGFAFPAVAFDSSGERLALVTRGRCRVWQLDTRQVIRDFPLAAPTYSQQVDWVDDTTLLVDGRHLVDVDRRIWLWQYQQMTPATQFVNGQLWYVAGNPGSGYVLASASFPDEAARKAVEATDPDSLLVVRPGMTASISISFYGTEEQRREVVDAMAKRLKDAGFTIADNAELQLVGSIKQGKTEDVAYRAFGTFRSQVSKHKATSQVLELTYQIGGKTVWSYTSTTSPPHFLDLEENETIDQALAREMSQDPENFNNVWLPSYVARGGDDGKPLGISATPGGSFN